MWKLKFKSLLVLLKQYQAVLKEAWEHRFEGESTKRLPHEIQFLPGHLALQETPVSPVLRVVLWSLTGLIFFVVLWAIFGKIDIVVSAEGKIIPNDKIKMIQPIETATVKSIFVKEGQQVKTGAPLVALDNTASEADVKRLSEEMLTAQLQSARARSFLDAIQTHATTALFSHLSLPVPEKQLLDQQALLQAEYAEFQDKRSAHQAAIGRAEAALKTTREIIVKLEQTAPMAKEQAQDLKKLLVKKFVSKHLYFEASKNSIDQTQELKAQKSRLEEIKAEIEENQKKLNALVSETTRTALSAANEASEKAKALSHELQKATQRNRLMLLKSPVEGTVQQLAVHTIGGVVTPAQPLMVIIPKDHPLEVEAAIENQDIGFVYAKQSAEVKIKAFPYTKYGTIPGTVLHLSTDAVVDEKKNLTYLARVVLSKTSLPVENKQVHLFPGMAVTVEIKTGKRRIIEYFLNPLLQYKSESLKER